MKIIVNPDGTVTQQQEVDGEKAFRAIKKEIDLIDAKIERAKKEIERMRERKKQLQSVYQEKKKFDEVKEVQARKMEEQRVLDSNQSKEPVEEVKEEPVAEPVVE